MALSGLLGPPMPGQPQGLLPRLSPMLLGMGAGLLSQGPSLTPQGPFSGLGRGLALGGELMALQRQQAMDYARLQQQQEESERKLRAEERARVEAQQARAAQTSALEAAGVPPEQRAGIIASGPEAVRAWLKPPDVPKDPEAIRVARILADPNTPQATKDALMEYRRAGGLRIEQSPDPLGTAAREYVMPDGSTPPVTMTEAGVVAAGGRLKTAGEIEAEKVAARKVEELRLRNEEIARATAAKERADAEFRANPNADTERAARVAANDLTSAYAYRATGGNEPGQAQLEQYEQPGPVRSAVEDIASEAARAVQDWWAGPPGGAAAGMIPGAGVPRQPQRTVTDRRNRATASREEITAAPMISNREAYDALPSGTLYIGRDGKPYRKP